MIAKLLIENRRAEILDNIKSAEFKAFSQFGDDGIIQHLINNIKIDNKTFIEFGVENYVEANTKLLLMNNNWKGLIIDGDKADIDSVKKSEIYWKYDLTAVARFITRDNINEIIDSNGFKGDLGILSIDIDGNDYWVWERIDVVNPVIVIVEYNSVFGKKYPVSILYDPDFIRSRAHYSHLYWGCSLKALCCLAEKKGYGFIGCNSNGNNAYFVRKDRLESIKPISPEEGYVESKYRESRDVEGRLSFISGKDRIKVIEDLLVVNVETNNTMQIKELF